MGYAPKILHAKSVQLNRLSEASALRSEITQLQFIVAEINNASASVMLGLTVPPFASPAVMRKCVASSAHSNQILFAIIAALAAKIFMMNFKVRSGSTSLAPPAIATQHLLS